ncbi:MAG: TrmH family RNA methyltransferase [Clostridia bacterium]|nr:TrmH family RNA methyltransferase [Clostridia bacterium]
MPKLEGYHRDLSYSYAPGLFPATACLRACPDRCMRLLVSEKIRRTEDVENLLEACRDREIRVETADRVLERLSRKENCYAAMVYRKAEGQFEAGPHIILHETSDSGNMGTIFRTALGLGYRNVAIIRPAVDSDDPRTVRASMGAAFDLQIRHFDGFDAYLAEFPEIRLFPFMLDGSVTLSEALQDVPDRYALVFGNEASGLPPRFSALGTAVRIPHNDRIDSLNLAIAAGIGMYAFSQRFEGEKR